MTPKASTTRMILAQKGVPPHRVEEKMSATRVGFGAAVFGALLTAAGIFVLVKVQPFNAWLLLVPAAGVFIAFVGGITMSKDVLVAAGEAVGVVRSGARALRGKNGHEHPPAADDDGPA
jgi:hypothetical protein